MPSSLYAVVASADASRTSGNAARRGGPHDAIHFYVAHPDWQRSIIPRAALPHAAVIRSPPRQGDRRFRPCRKGSLRQVSSLRQISFGLGKAATTAGGLNVLRRGGRERLRPLLRRDWQTRPDGLGRYRSARDLVP